jgi:hypothetical protein
MAPNRGRTDVMGTVGGGRLSEHAAFWIDHEYDRERADDGISRYGAHVRSNLDEFSGSWGDIAPVAFACAAWRLATPPVLSPGYVRWHRRVLDASCVRNSWDGTLTAQVNLVSPWPAALTWSRDWWQDRGWQDWPEVFGQFVEPAERDLAKIPYLRASLLVEGPVPLDDLPGAPEGPGDDIEGTARRAVIVLVKELNELVSPLLRQLDKWQSAS